MSKPTDKLTIGIAQIAPVLLDKIRTLDKIKEQIKQAGEKGCQLVVFGEALLPGYPFWVELTEGARFNSAVQKDIYSYYLQQAVQVEQDLDVVCRLAAEYNVAVYLGCMERAADRGGHTLYCSLVYINQEGRIASVHRKLMPTFEERLVWGQGDGAGLKVHPLGAFTVGGLNCWENWMPLARTSLYAQGENLHVAVWPGSVRNTEDITRFIARESRSYVISASSLMRKDDFSADIPHLSLIKDNSPDVLANGGSCIAGPTGEWVLAPVANQEGLLMATIDFEEVRKERQNFDVAGHYSRPDVLKLNLNRARQSGLQIEE
jgi:nitrilase